MDHKSVNYSEKCYLEIQKYLLLKLKKIGFKEKFIKFVPISSCGLNADNIFQKSEKMEWFEGLSLLETMDNIEPPKRAKLEKRPLRFCVQVCYINKRSY